MQDRYSFALSDSGDDETIEFLGQFRDENEALLPRSHSVPYSIVFDDEIEDNRHTPSVAIKVKPHKVRNIIIREVCYNSYMFNLV